MNVLQLQTTYPEKEFWLHIYNDWLSPDGTGISVWSSGTTGAVTPPPTDKVVRLQPGLPASGLAPPGLGKSLHSALCQHMPLEPEGIRLS